ncbi:MAG: DUF4389 domain-containing protein [Ilumatobacteraceae bacterium]
MQPSTSAYPARLSIEYPDRELDRLSTGLRILYLVPIFVVACFLTASNTGAALFVPLVLLLLFRRKYPRWWFDFNLQLSRFSTRISAYAALMSDTYPSTDEEQFVHLELDYPDASTELNRWLPLVKWFLAIPHYLALAVLSFGAMFAVFAAWFVILFTGRYPRPIFDYVEGVLRWSLRVQAYAFLLITDRYPPFSLH